MLKLKKPVLPKIGMRKVKSLVAICAAFVVWQLLRLIIPYKLDIHPLFGYVYAIIEIRETPEKTKQFSFYRIKATMVGLTIGLSLLPVSVYFSNLISNSGFMSLVHLALILFGVLATICIAEVCKCENFCGIAAIIFVICMIRDRSDDVNIYSYAILRVVQTLVGVFSAWLVNTYFFRKHTKESNQT